MRSVVKKNAANFKLLFVAIGLGMAIVACINPKKETYFGATVPKHPPTELYLSNGSEPQYTDPQKVSGVPDGEIVRNMFARLIQIHPETGKVVPDLAEKWDVSEDGREYIFHLRPGLVWSDGKPLDAATVEWSWKRAVDPNTASVYAQMAHVIAHAKEFTNRYLWVRNLPDDFDIDAFKSEVAKITAVTDWVSSEFVEGYMFDIAGDADQKNELRKQVMRQFDARSYGDRQIKVSIADSSVVQVKALDGNKLWVRLTGSLPYFLSLIDFNLFAPSPKHVIDKIAKRDGKDDLWVRPENIACSGAYCLKELEFRHFRVFEKNPKYWDAQNVRIERVKMYHTESANTQLFMYRTGEIDWTGTAVDVPSEYVEDLNHMKDYHNDPYLGVYFYAFNVDKKPFDDKRVRQALSKAIDRTALTGALGGGQLPYANLVPEGLGGYKGLDTPLFEPEEAKRLLAEAGYPDGKGFPKNIAITYNTLELHKQVAQAIQQMWRKHLNIEIELNNREWKVYLDDMTAGNYHIMRRGWIGDYLDPYTFLSLLMSEDGNNRTRWGSPEYDRLMFEGNNNADFDMRLQMFQDAEKIAIDEQAFLPLFIYVKIYFKKPYLRGFWPDYQGHHMWKFMWIDERFYDGNIHSLQDNEKARIGGL